MIYYKNEQMIIYNDDSLEKIKVFKPNHFDAVITDPPYSFGLASFSGVGNNKVSKWGDLLNQSYFFRELINNAKRCLKKNGVIWLFANWRMLPVLMKGTIEANESIESVLIWDKDWIGPGGSKGLRPSYEIVVLICPGDKGILNRGIRDIVTVPWSSNKKYHPAEKPVGLLEHLVKISTLEDDVVLDMFMGSGTTAVACQKLNRQFIGIEIDEKYCEITKGRLSQNNLFKPARKQAAGKQLKCELED